MRPHRLFVLLWAPLLLTGQALAQGPAGPPDGPGPGWRLRGHVDGRGPGQLLAGLDLDAAQREKVQALHLQAEKARVRQRAEVEVAELELRELLQAESPDRKQVHAQVDRLTKLRGDLHKLDVDRRLDLLALLTPQQREALRTLRAQGPGWGRRGAGDGSGRGLPRGGPGWGPGPGPLDDGSKD